MSLLGDFANFLFGMDDTGKEARDYIAKNSKEGVDPRSNISDYGEFDEDFNQEDRDRSSGNAAKRDDHGVGFPTLGETEAFYDSTRYTDIKIVRRDE